jgi:hypothetical protein
VIEMAVIMTKKESREFIMLNNLIEQNNKGYLIG